MTRTVLCFWTSWAVWMGQLNGGYTRGFNARHRRVGTLYLGVSVVHRELEQKTVYFIIPKPLHRTEFLLGKFLGMSATLVIQLIVMSGVFFMVLLAYGGGASVVLLKALLLTLAEVLVILSVALFLSSLTGPILAGFLSLALFLLGRSSEFMRQLGGSPDSDCTWGETQKAA